jgi:DnaJ-class molecular chaperone
MLLKGGKMRPKDRKKNGNNGVKKVKCDTCRGSGKALEGGAHIRGIRPIITCPDCGGNGEK